MDYKITLSVLLSTEQIAHMQQVGPIEWGAIGPKPDDQHVADFISTLAKTRENFGLAGDASLSLHGVFACGTDVIEAITGTSPNSPLRAAILAALWNQALGPVSVKHAQGVIPVATELVRSVPPSLPNIARDLLLTNTSGQLHDAAKAYLLAELSEATKQLSTSIS